MDDPQAIEIKPERQRPKPVEVGGQFARRDLPHGLGMLVGVLLVVRPEVFARFAGVGRVESQGVELVVAHHGEGSAGLHHGPDDLESFPDLGAAIDEVAEEDRLPVGVAIDAATPELFERFRGRGVKGPHRWEHYWATLEEAVRIFGRYKVGVHLIVGLGEPEQEMIAAIQRAHDLGAHTHLFSFFPEGGTLMDDHPQPPYGQYRRVQLARYIINGEHGRYEQMDFNDAGQVVDFGVETAELIQYGEPFMTSGCPGPDGRVACNRPFGNERAGRPIRNYAFPPEPEDVELIRYQLRDYGDGR